MRTSIRSSAFVLGAVIAACSSTPPKTDGGTSGTGDAGPATGTVQGAVDAASKGPGPVQISTAVVVAASSYTSSSGQTGTFYIQDPAPNSGTGLSVYVSASDNQMFPNVGDTVSVQGYVSTYDGSLQVSSDSSSGTALVINDSGAGGMSSAGAYPPAGSPTNVTAVGQYAHTESGAHPEQVGQALHFAGPLAITDDAPTDFVETTDGGTSQQGFEITGNVWVWDTNIYYDCMMGKAPDGGTLYPDLGAGITGVWDHYQDYGDSSAQDYPVLIPQTCADVNMSGGTTTTDGGTVVVVTGDDGGTATDAGPAVTYMSTTVQDAFNTAESTGESTSINVELDNVVVVASSSYTSTAGATSGTFYVQDAKPNSGNGIGVYVASTDTAAGTVIPSIGDVVTVKGNLSFFIAEVQISSYAKIGVTLSVTPGTGTATVSSGAYSPAGTPTAVAAGGESDYAAATAGQKSQLGTVIKLAGPLSVTADKAPNFVHTKTDGGTSTEGFEITHNIYVYDTNVYDSCIEGKGADGGPGYPSLSGGITGVWDRFTDYGVDGGAIFGVIIPQTCADIGVQ